MRQQDGITVDVHHWVNRKVLVTGGAGFIGSHLVEDLVAMGAQVTIIDDFRNSTPSNLVAVSDKIRFLKWDVSSPDVVALLRQFRFDIVFHLASNAYVPPSVKDPWSDCQNVLLNTLRVLEAIRLHSPESIFIYASSAAVYGNPGKLPITEDDPTVPISPYGVSKLAAERYVHVYSRLYEIKAASLRFFSVYGPRQHKQVVYDLINKLRTNSRELHIIGNGKQVRDFMFVKDLVQAVLLIASNAPLQGEVYNVASGGTCTTFELAQVISRTLGVDPSFIFDNQLRSGDPDKWEAKITRLLSLGFIPRYSLAEGMKIVVEWINAEEHRKRDCYPYLGSIEEAPKFP